MLGWQHSDSWGSFKKLRSRDVRVDSQKTPEENQYVMTKLVFLLGKCMKGLLLLSMVKSWTHTHEDLTFFFDISLNFLLCWTKIVMCGVFKTILVGRSEWEWLQELGKSRAGACQEARHQKYSLYKAEAQIGPGKEGDILTCKSHLENDKRGESGQDTGTSTIILILQWS